jgi:L-ascorbate metabolism protein UlaG (beta-lactamase superfamily)
MTPVDPPQKRIVLRLFLALLGSAILLGALACASAWTAMGEKPSKARLNELKDSPQFGEKAFENVLKPDQPHYREMFKRYWGDEKAQVEPKSPIEVMARQQSDFDRPPANGVRVTWLGHSTMLVEIDGFRILTDPVWGERASPFGYMGPKRFHVPPLPLEELPHLDAVVISHDHYDHLDHETIVALKERDVPFVVPLGLGSHLSYWGIPEERIFELDWWQKKVFKNGLELVCTPARHFSGRSGMQQNVTLWAGWAILGPEHRAFFSGDSAMLPEYLRIGEEYGPFDVTMIENGAYNELWADYHLGPEQAVQAHRMVKGRLLIPIHWGTFNLALHSWVEPAERIVAAAAAQGVVVAVPRPGQMIEPPPAPELVKWWPGDVGWQKASEAPVTSSGLPSDLKIPAALPLLEIAPENVGGPP